MATLSPTEQKRLGLVRPELMQALLALNDVANQQLGFTLAVAENGGTRSMATQQALYADSIAQGGGSLAYPVGTPGHSRHQYGAAFDVHITAGGSNADGTGDDDDYAAVAAAGEQLGLIAGYYFAQRGQAQKDPYHFELNETLQQSIDRWNAMRAAGIGKATFAIAMILAAGFALHR